MTSDAAPEPVARAQSRRAAEALGARLVDVSTDPAAFVCELEAGLARLTPGSAPDHAARTPLQRLHRQVRASLAGTSSSTALDVAGLLERNGSREVRRFALPFLEHALDAEPERAWQSLRRLGQGAQDRVEVDALAVVWARGVRAEPFRWAELEQLVYSARPMERRLVGATLAHIPLRLPADARGRLRGELARHVLPTLAMLMGDDEELVQKSLSWALRAWTPIEAGAIEVFLRDQTAIAEEHGDGHRARVVRDSLAGLPVDVAKDLRQRLAAIRRTPDAPATSRAALLAAAFEPSVAAVPGQAEQGQRYARVRP